MSAAVFLLPAVERAAPPVTVQVNELFAAHAAFLVRTLERLTGDRAHAEDLVQEAFLVAHRKRHELRPDGNPRAWLYRVAMNLFQRSRRRFARELRFLGRVSAEPGTERRLGAPDAPALERERAARVRKAVSRLPLVYREVFVLFELEALSGAEIAALLDIPVATVWTRLHRARELFRGAWAQSEARSEVRGEPHSGDPRDARGGQG